MGLRMCLTVATGPSPNMAFTLLLYSGRMDMAAKNTVVPAMEGMVNGLFVGFCLPFIIEKKKK